MDSAMRNANVDLLLSTLRAGVRDTPAPPPQPIDERIDRDRFETMLAAHRPWMLRKAASIVGATQAEDVVQRALLSVFRAQNVDLNEPRAYLATAVVNEANRWRKVMSRRQEVPLPDADRPAAHAEDDLDARSRLL